MINKENILFLQHEHSNIENIIINTYLIWAKQYRYRISLDKTNLDFKIFEKEVECRKRMLEIIAQKNNNIDRYKAIWEK